MKTLVDTDGEALQHALEVKPTVITPNQHEAERLLNRAILTRSQFPAMLASGAFFARKFEESADVLDDIDAFLAGVSRPSAGKGSRTPRPKRDRSGAR